MDPLTEEFADLSVAEPISATPSLPRVSPEHDHFNDDDHKLLDEEILQTFSAFTELNKAPDLSALLSFIALGDKRLLTLTRGAAKELLSSQPSINDVLQEAWKEASFKHVRQLSVLWPVVREAPSRRIRPLNEDVGLTSKALESAWHDSYLGNNHRLLFDNIKAIERTDKPYSNQIAIVQSSGTGKSRMVHEQANLVFTIPFNLREMGDNQDLAYPMPDDAVRNYLVTTSYSDDQHTLKANYLKFLGSVFKQVNSELEEHKKSLKKKKKMRTEDLAKWWSIHLKDRRTELYETAIDDARKPTQILPDIEKHHKELLAKRRSEPENSQEPHDNLTEFAAGEAAKDELSKLMEKLVKLVGLQEVQLIIYFDEAHPLTKVEPKNDDQKTLYDFLCSCLNQFLSFRMFCIFLSTNSSLAQFASPQALAKSARIRRGLAELHPPITETPFDCCGDLKVKPGVLTVKDISMIPYMAQFGRPLFWTLLRGAGVIASNLHREILELARAKLIGFREIDSSYGTFSNPARLAVLDVQLSLDFEPRREKVQIEEARLVESHMRIAYSIPDHREYLRSGYPSEPLLAEAAAQQLWRWRTQHPFIAVETLNKILKTGLLDRGELGELTGRQLLLDAYHRAVEQEQGDRSKKTPPNFSAGCRLITFINMLFTDEYAGRVLDSKPDNVEGTSFKEAFKDAIICFTHFGKMADDTGVTSAAAWAAFMRHMAIMCRNGQNIIDCILPVLLWDTGLCEHVMTGVLIQFKRRIQSGTIAGYSIDQAKFNFFPKTLEKCTHGSSADASYRPYISLIMELGVQPKAPKEAKTATIYQSSSKKKSGDRPRTPPPTEAVADHGTPSKMHIPTCGQKHHPETGHARYNVFAYGCSPTVYRGIDDAHKASYALLLSSRDFLGEHPRQDAQTLKAVRMMKPFWSGGDDCYHWIEHDNVLRSSVPPSGVEFSVGK